MNFFEYFHRVSSYWNGKVINHMLGFSGKWSCPKKWLLGQLAGLQFLGWQRETQVKLNSAVSKHSLFRSVYFCFMVLHLIRWGLPMLRRIISQLIVCVSPWTAHFHSGTEKVGGVWSLCQDVGHSKQLSFWFLWSQASHNSATVPSQSVLF